jgi:hypothetical protein
MFHLKLLAFWFPISVFSESSDRILHFRRFVPPVLLGLALEGVYILGDTILFVIAV